MIVFRTHGMLKRIDTTIEFGTMEIFQFCLFDVRFHLLLKRCEMFYF